MTDPNTPFSEHDLDALFTEARQNDPAPSDAFMDRLMADAQDLAPRPLAKGSHENWFTRAFSELGGWPSFVGLATAAAAGVWFGLNPSLSLSDSGSEYLMSNADIYLSEIFPSDLTFAEEL